MMSNCTDDLFYVDILLEFIEVLIHQIIYLRDVYPASVFVTRRKFNLPLQMSQHPLINEYITKVVASMKKYLSKPESDVDSVDIVVSGSGGHVDRFRLEFGSLAGPSINSSGRSDQFMVELEMTLASFLLRLAQAIAGMSPSKEEREWWVELGTTEQGAMRLMEGEVWCVAESDKGGGGNIVPVMVAQIPFKMQLYVQIRD